MQPPRRYPSDIPSSDPLWSFVTAVDATLAATHADDNAVIRVSARPDPARRPGDALSWFPLDGAHPLTLLLGFTAPPDWHALGVSCAGHDGQSAPADDGLRITALLDRTGGSAAVLRRGRTVSRLAGAPDGVVADACRRALSLPTAGPPATTAPLWTLIWLDRVISVAAPSGPAGCFSNWDELAALHPSAVPLQPGRRPTQPAQLPAPSADTRHERARVDAAALVARSLALTAAWPWHRLRDEPDSFDLPGGADSRRLAPWMDDGMWARWLLGALPPVTDLLDAACALLPSVLVEPVVMVAQATSSEAAR